jgi:RHS repeat-associated protein
LIYYHRDRRNDVVATTTSGGHMGLSYRYLPSGAADKVLDANGNPGAETESVASELGFIGGLKLSGGLIHLRARAYSPMLRRFLQPDTLDFRRYTYAGGDALNQIDPNGRAGGPDEDDEPEHADDPGEEGGVPGDGQRPDAGTEEITVSCCRQPQPAPTTVTMGDLIGQTPDQPGPTLTPAAPESSGIYAPGNTYGPNLSSMIGGSTQTQSGIGQPQNVAVTPRNVPGTRYDTARAAAYYGLRYAVDHYMINDHAHEYIGTVVKQGDQFTFTDPQRGGLGNFAVTVRSGFVALYSILTLGVTIRAWCLLA